jgi:hypothetical protein
MTVEGKLPLGSIILNYLKVLKCAGQLGCCPRRSRSIRRERIGPLPSHFNGLRRFEALEEINSYPNGPLPVGTGSALRRAGASDHEHVLASLCDCRVEPGKLICTVSISGRCRQAGSGRADISTKISKGQH